MISESIEVRPQTGFQDSFLRCKADICIGGGAAGAGKTFGLLIDPLRHVGNPKFRATIFRRLMTQVKNEGGLWDTSEDLYPRIDNPDLKGRGYRNRALWVFKSGARVRFAHLQYEDDKLSYQGAQIPLIGWDELTHFTKTQFFYLLSRNRSTSGVRPYVRATTNPQGQGWVKDMISWWLYPDNFHIDSLAGYPIPERSGKIRFFTRSKGKYVWGNSAAQVIKNLPSSVRSEYEIKDIKSLTFIPGLLSENKKLLEIDTAYKSNLLAMEEAEMEQLLKGRWLDIGMDESRIYSYAALKDVFTNTFVPAGKKFMTADIALEGSDKFIVGIWEGWRLTHIYSFEKSMGNEIVNTLKLLASKHKVAQRNIIYDYDGVGGFIKGYLPSAYAFSGGRTPIEVKGVKENFRNLRSQCYYLLRPKIENCEIFIAAPISESESDIIIEELYSIKRGEVKSDGKLFIVPKEEIRSEIGRSPDYADMLMMRVVGDYIKNPGTRSTKVF